MSLFVLQNVSKTYGQDGGAVNALRGINLEIPAGQFIVILGPSGSGKSTLLNILGGMDTPTSGTVLFNGQDISGYTAKQLTDYRKKQIGFVFQSYNLLSDLTAQENVEFSTEIAKLPRDGAKAALSLVGLGERLSHYPSEMSGGEQQRVSIARSIAKRPAVLLCDEPTGALDYKTGKQKLVLYGWVLIMSLNLIIIAVSVINRDWLKAALFILFAALSSAEILAHKRKNRNT